MKRVVAIHGGDTFNFYDTSIKDCAEKAVAEQITRDGLKIDGYSRKVYDTTVVEEDGMCWKIPVEVELKYTATNLRQGMKDE